MTYINKFAGLTAVAGIFASMLLSLPAAAQTGMTQQTTGTAQPSGTAQPTSTAQPTGTASPDTTQSPLPSVPVAPPVNEALPDYLQYKSPYTGEQSDLNKPNRSGNEILAWTQEKVTDAMTLSPANFNAKVGEIKHSFTPAGWNDYGAFMHTNQIVDALQTQHYDVVSIVEGDAHVLTSDALNGSYHWLVDLPVIVTFTARRPDGTVQQIGGGKYHMLVQVGRTADTDAPDGVLIESWKAKARK